jgi:hypothetical protein
MSHMQSRKGGQCYRRDCKSSAQFYSQETPGDNYKQSQLENSISLFGTTQLSKYSPNESTKSKKINDIFPLTKEDLGFLSHSVPLNQKDKVKVNESAVTFKQKADNIFRNY